jgi:hypothetical protein
MSRLTKKTVNVLLISRTEDYLNGVYKYIPKEHKDYPEGKVVTCKEEYTSNHYVFHKNEIALVNKYTDHKFRDKGHEQLVILPTITGIPDFGCAANYLTLEQMVWLYTENAKMLAITKLDPHYAKAMDLNQ